MELFYDEPRGSVDGSWGKEALVCWRLATGKSQMTTARKAPPSVVSLGIMRGLSLFTLSSCSLLTRAAYDDNVHSSARTPPTSKERTG